MVKFIATTTLGLTNWKSDALYNRHLQQQLGITSDHEYRLYLQRNAESLMAQQRQGVFERAREGCNCPSCGMYAMMR